jgi:hypothetical protein
MAKREIDYGNLTVTNRRSEPVIQEHAPETAEQAELPAPPRETELLKDVAQSILLYIHPDAHKQLLEESIRRTSFRNRVRVHDLIIEALESWFQDKALPGPVRAKERPSTSKGRARR